MYSGEGTKKHKKHKKEKDREKYEEKPYGSTLLDKSSQRLKLILKVGGSSTPEHSDSPGPPLSLNLNLNMSYDDDSQHSHKKSKKKDKKKKNKKHKHKDKKKKTKEERMEVELMAPTPLITKPILIPFPPVAAAVAAPPPPPTTQAIIEEPMVVEETPNPEETGREQRACVKKNDKPLQKLLDYLLKNLEKKDPQNFFAWPVTDKIAPGYSSIISKPMDFSTMRAKVDECEYGNLEEFKADFILMCENAMTYNHVETIYYKAAKKLSQTGVKSLTEEKIRPLIPLMPSIRLLNEEDLGFNLFPDPIDQDIMMMTSNEEETLKMEVDPKENEHYMPPHPKDPPDFCGSFTEELTSQEVLQQARLAAREAAHRLATRKPKSNMGFLRLRKDGSTSLAILVPTTGVMPGSKEQPLTLGALTGKINQGSAQLIGNKDDKKVLRGVKPLYYGAFSTYAPNHDSTFSTLTSEETELVNSTYGDETAVQYAESLIEFAKGCDYSMTMVDEILDTLTRGQHSRTVNLIEERKKMEEEIRLEKKASEEDDSYLEKIENIVQMAMNSRPAIPPTQTETIDLASLSSLGELGIDTSFLNGYRERDSISKKLEETAELIGNLEKLQLIRLGQPSRPGPPYVNQPTEEEIQIADKIIENLIGLVKKVYPGEIASTAALRRAMGVKLAHSGPPIFPDLLKLMEPHSSTQSDSQNEDAEDSQNSNSITNESQIGENKDMASAVAPIILENQSVIEDKTQIGTVS